MFLFIFAIIALVIYFIINSKLEKTKKIYEECLKQILEIKTEMTQAETLEKRIENLLIKKEKNSNSTDQINKLKIQKNKLELHLSSLKKKIKYKKQSIQKKEENSSNPSNSIMSSDDSYWTSDNSSSSSSSDSSYDGGGGDSSGGGSSDSW